MSTERLPVILVSSDETRWSELVAALEPRFVPIAVRSVDEIDRLALGRYAVVAEGGDAAAILSRAIAGEPIDAIVLLAPRDDPSLDGLDAGLAALTAPVLIFTGEDDPVVPVSSVEALGERIPTSTLGIVPDCGPDLVREAPGTIFPMIVEYLRARYARVPHGHEGPVMLQLEPRPPWLDEPEDEEPSTTPDPAEQEVGPNA